MTRSILLILLEIFNNELAWLINKEKKYDIKYMGKCFN